jgi:Zn-dependent protease
MITREGVPCLNAKGARRVIARVLETAPRKPHPTADARPSSIESEHLETAAARCLLAQRRTVPATPGYHLLFLVSLLASSIAFGLWLGWDTTFIVLAVIFIHEMGHWIGMKLCGYEDPRIFFVPLFGGVATGRKDRKTVGQELLVLLLGPVPGLFLALAAYWAGATWSGRPDWLWRFTLITFVINYLNLLPVLPLDGGRIVQALFLRRLPRLGFVFSGLSTLAVGAGALFLQSWILGILALFGFFRIRTELLLGRAKKAVLDGLSADEAGDPSRSTRRALEVLDQAALPNELRPFPQRGALVNQIVTALQHPPPSTFTMLLGALAYLASLVIPLALGIILLLSLPPWRSELRDSPDRAPSTEGRGAMEVRGEAI